MGAMDYVGLELRRNRGWPWPESSFGKDPLFGEGGWCATCGIPNGPQVGSLILQRKGFKVVAGGWVPYWAYDVLCLERELGARVADKFGLTLRDVEWHPAAPGAARQVVIPVVGSSWFDPAELERAELERDAETGRTCAVCGRWKWLPLGFGELPTLSVRPGLDGAPIAASPEWFGDGAKAFREVVVRRDLAEEIAAATPRDFKITEIDMAA